MLLGMVVEGHLAPVPLRHAFGAPPPHRKSMRRNYLTEKAPRYSGFTALSSASVTGRVNS